MKQVVDKLIEGDTNQDVEASFDMWKNV